MFFLVTLFVRFPDQYEVIILRRLNKNWTNITGFDEILDFRGLSKFLFENIYQNICSEYEN